MNRKKLLIFIFIVAIYFMPVFGQDSIFRREVTVEREYVPVIKEAGKINLTPKLYEPQVEKLSPVYTEFYLPLPVETNIHPLQAIEFSLQQEPLKNGYAKMGWGNYYNSLLDFAYPFIKKEDMYLDFTVHHLSTYGNKWHTTSDASLFFNKDFKNLDFFTGVNGSYERLKYYGNNFNLDSIVDLKQLAGNYPSAIYLPTDKEQPIFSYSLKELSELNRFNTFWRGNIYGGVQSKSNTSDIQYVGKLDYSFLNAGRGSKEHQILLSGKFQIPYNDNKLGLDADLLQLNYNSKVTDSTNIENSYSVFIIHPYYDYHSDKFRARLGIQSAFSFEEKGFLHLYPDIQAEWQPFPTWMAIYGGITGNYQVNSRSKILKENCFADAYLKVNDTFTPFEGYLGIKLKPAELFFVDAFIDYQHINNQYFFINKEFISNDMTEPNNHLFINRFDVTYSKTDLLRSGLRLSYHLQDRFSCELKGVYNDWQVSDEPYAWNKPKWEADMNLHASLASNIHLSAKIFYQSGRYAKLEKKTILMKSAFDVNMGISYNYSRFLTVFAKVNNFFNSSYQYFYGYDVQGTNFLLGVALSF